MRWYETVRFWRSCLKKTLGAAAEKAAIGQRTLRRWLADDAKFQADYEKARQATFKTGIRSRPSAVCQGREHP